METSALVGNFNQQKHFEYQKVLPKVQKIFFWIYNNPTTIKILEVAGIALGMGMVAALPLSLPALGAGGGAIALSVAGGIVAAVSFLAYEILDIVVSPHHEMQYHTFKPAELRAAAFIIKGTSRF